MDVVECIEGRTSIREFISDPVDDQVIAEGLRLANLAPSAGNLQARDFIIVKDLRTKKRLMEASHGQDYVSKAPAVIVFCANMKRIDHYGDRGRNLYSLQDVAAAIQNFSLYLHGKGLGSVWVGAFDEEIVSSALNLPDHARPVAMVPIGYPVDKGIHRKRLALDEIVHHEKW